MTVESSEVIEEEEMIFEAHCKMGAILSDYYTKKLIREWGPNGTKRRDKPNSAGGNGSGNSGVVRGRVPRR